MPFHYGYWDDPGRPRAANELTLYEWDPVSKQPHFKYAAVRLEKVAGASLPQPDESKYDDGLVEAQDDHEDRAPLADDVGRLLSSEEQLIRGWEKLRSSHRAAPDIGMQSALFMTWSRENAAALRLRAPTTGGPEPVGRALAIGGAKNPLGLLRDLQALWLMVQESTASVAALLQGARALADHELEGDLSGIENRNDRQRRWLLARIRQAAPQALTVPSPTKGRQQMRAGG